MNAKAIATALLTLLSQGVSPEKISAGFLVFAKKNHIEGLIDTIVWYLEYFSKQYQRNEAVEIIAAHSISPDTIEAIRDSIGAINAQTIVTEDTSLVAGFIARYKGTQYDASIKTQLSRLRQAISSK